MARNNRVLPHNLDAERAVLGAILLRDDMLAMVTGVVTERDFFRVAHQHIYRAMLQLGDKHQAVDLTTVKNALGDYLDEVGGPAYISALIDGVPRTINAEHYARIIREKAILRELIINASKLIDRAYDPSEDAREVVQAAEGVIYGLSERETDGALVGGQQLAQEGHALLERLNASGHIAGISTGLTLLDNAMLGLHASNLQIVAARPGKGKSAYALHLARQLGIIQRLVVAMFSLEMSREEIVMRLMAAESQVSGHAMRSNMIPQSAYPRLSEALCRIGDSGIYIDDTPGRTMLQVRSLVRRLKARAGRLDAVIIDYLQLMTPVHRRDQNREQEVANMAWACKMLAKELRLPVVLLSQLNRSPEQREGTRPKLSDLRESGAIEQHADEVVFVHPPADPNGTCELIVAKQRNGPTTAARVAYFPSEFRFANLIAEQC